MCKQCLELRMNVAMACSTQNVKTSAKHAKTLVVLGQRHINITRNPIGPKSGQNGCRKILT